MGIKGNIIYHSVLVIQLESTTPSISNLCLKLPQHLYVVGLWTIPHNGTTNILFRLALECRGIWHQLKKAHLSSQTLRAQPPMGKVTFPAIASKICTWVYFWGTDIDSRPPWSCKYANVSKLIKYLFWMMLYFLSFFVKLYTKIYRDTATT